MTHQRHDLTRPFRAGWTRERLEYRVALGLALGVCLVAVAARRAAGSGAQESIWAEARGAAHAAIGYAFTA